MNKGYEEVNALDKMIELCMLRDDRIAKLQDKLQAVNDDYNHDHKVHDDYANGLLLEIKELKDVIKEYKKKANIYYYEELKKTRVLLKKEYAENVSLKAENIDLINHADFIKQDKFKKIIDTLQAENVSLKAELKYYTNKYREINKERGN